MTTAAWRLLLCAGLFAGWLGYLGYQVATRPSYGDPARPLVVSRPQVLVSAVDVVAEVRSTDGPVTVRQVLWPKEGAPLHEGDEIKVTNLDECRATARLGEEERPPLDFAGPGEYLLPLRPVAQEKNTYEVVRIPASPGYLSDGNGPPRFYPASHAALAQYHAIRKPGE
jgi:hypothetical protein